MSHEWLVGECIDQILARKRMVSVPDISVCDGAGTLASCSTQISLALIRIFWAVNSHFQRRTRRRRNLIRRVSGHEQDVCAYIATRRTFLEVQRVYLAIDRQMLAAL